MPRPYIPLKVRELVIMRQFREAKTKPTFGALAPTAIKIRLQRLLEEFFLGEPVHLHHRPALCNREFDLKTQDWIPRANDPDYLVYLPVQDHDIETRVRGMGAQRSDFGQRRYLKKVARNRQRTPERLRGDGA